MHTQREKPDKAASSDHSFYLSKIKICLLTLPGGSTGEGRGGGGGGSSRRKRLDESSGVFSSNVSSNVSSNDSITVGGGGGSRSSPLPTHGRDGFGVIPEGFRNDKAGRSGGWGGIGDDGIGDGVAAVGSAAFVSRGLEAGGRQEGEASPPPSSHEPPRVLSIHFFGRSVTLNLWFSREEEGTTWQVCVCVIDIEPFFVPVDM